MNWFAGVWAGKQFIVIYLLPAFEFTGLLTMMCRFFFLGDTKVQIYRFGCLLQKITPLVTSA